MKLVDALVTCLRDWGVDHLFGVSGAYIEHVLDAIVVGLERMLRVGFTIEGEIVWSP